MKVKATGSLILVAALVLLGTSDYKPGGRIIRISTVAHGLQISGEFDVRASHQLQGPDSIINFGGHEMIVINGLLIVDGDKWKFGIPACTSKVELQLHRGLLAIRLIQTTV